MSRPKGASPSRRQTFNHSKSLFVSQISHEWTWSCRLSLDVTTAELNSFPETCLSLTKRPAISMLSHAGTRLMRSAEKRSEKLQDKECVEKQYINVFSFPNLRRRSESPQMDITRYPNHSSAMRAASQRNSMSVDQSVTTPARFPSLFPQPVIICSRGNFVDYINMSPAIRSVRSAT